LRRPGNRVHQFLLFSAEEGHSPNPENTTTMTRQKHSALVKRIKFKWKYYKFNGKDSRFGIKGVGSRLAGFVLEI